MSRAHLAGVPAGRAGPWADADASAQAAHRWHAGRSYVTGQPSKSASTDVIEQVWHAGRSGPADFGLERPFRDRYERPTHQTPRAAV